MQDRHPFQPRLETLERRDVPAAVTSNLTAGSLTVYGTSGSDQITVALSGSRIVVSGITDGTQRAQQTYTASAVTRIVVAAEGGNDVVDVKQAIAKTAWIYGGSGSDYLYGGAGGDTIYGGQGSDRLYGRNGNDVLFGGAGTDLLDGGLGANSVAQDSRARTLTTLNSIESQILQLVNAERTSRGLTALTFNAQLNAAARWHSSDMATRSNTVGASAAMQHTLNGVLMPTPSNRIDFVGYDNYTTWGENIAYGYSTAAAVMTAWMNSPGHRANILSASFREIGVSVVYNASGLPFFTQVFGSRV